MTVSTALPTANRWRMRLAHAFRADSGVAAVEFSLILPLMLTLYLGSVEVTKGVLASRKVALVSRSLADIASQQLTCSNTALAPCLVDSDMTTIFGAATAILAPYNTTNLKMTVSQVLISSAAGVLSAKTDWTVINNSGTARPCQVLTAADVAPGSTGYQSKFPTGFTTTGSPTGAIIVADVSYTYTPGFGHQLMKWATPTTLSMTQVQYMRTRSGSNINPQMTTGATDCP